MHNSSRDQKEPSGISQNLGIILIYLMDRELAWVFVDLNEHCEEATEGSQTFQTPLSEKIFHQCEGWMT